MPAVLGEFLAAILRVIIFHVLSFATTGMYVNAVGNDNSCRISF